MKNEFMLHAVELARRGKGNTRTNPCVGALIVKNGEIVGTGWHMYYGGPHAEINALMDAGDLASGADLYVTLEPCSTYGNTPPCTESIISSGIKRVFIGVLDPNPSHCGKGVNILLEAGIEVEWGIEKEKCAVIIADFAKYVTTNIPFVTLKVAQSVDGKIATVTGASKWITSVESRTKVHELRKINDAVLVGVGTVLADDPELTVRVGALAKQPIRVVLDSLCRIPLDSKLVRTSVEGVAPLVVFTTTAAASEKVSALKELGVDVIVIGDFIELKSVLMTLGSLNVMNVMVEGGSQIFGSFINAGLVDDFHFFIAPIIIGGDAAKGSIGGAGILELSEATVLKHYLFQRCGDDIWVYARVSDYVTDTLRLTAGFVPGFC